MKKLLLCIALSFSSLGYAATPSEQSVRALLASAGADSAYEASMTLTDGYLKQMMRMVVVAESGVNATAEEQKLADTIAKSMANFAKEELSWKVMEPIYVKSYRESFNQSDINSMLKFYKSETGKSVAKKVPALTTETMNLGLERMQKVTPKVMKAVQEAMAKMEKDTAD